MKTTGTWDCACVNHPPSWIDALDLECDAFYVTVFQSLRFHLSTLETKPFQKDAFSNEYALVWMGLGLYLKLLCESCESFEMFSICARRHRKRDVTTVFTYSDLNTPIDQ